MSDIKNAAFIGNLILRGKFECLTGLHIGGSKEKLEIGGVDSPVVRDPRTKFPYVPGSSLKGKMRSLLEFALGKVPLEANPKRRLDAGGVSDAAEIVRLFGIGVDQREQAKDNPQDHLYNIGPSRLIIRDCHADEETKKMWKGLDTDLLYTEYKSENGINRITSAANPRFIERVATGSRFDFEMVYSIFDLGGGKETYRKAAEEDLDNLRMALFMLEHNFLGKSGSRGYGRIKFGFSDPVWITVDDYKNGADVIAQASKPLADFKQLHKSDTLNLTIPGHL